MSEWTTVKNKKEKLYTRKDTREQSRKPSYLPKNNGTFVPRYKTDNRQTGPPKFLIELLQKRKDESTINTSYDELVHSKTICEKTSLPDNIMTFVKLLEKNQSMRTKEFGLEIHKRISLHKTNDSRFIPIFNKLVESNLKKTIDLIMSEEISTPDKYILATYITKKGICHMKYADTYANLANLLNKKVDISLSIGDIISLKHIDYFTNNNLPLNDDGDIDSQHVKAYSTFVAYLINYKVLTESSITTLLNSYLVKDSKNSMLLLSFVTLMKAIKNRNNYVIYIKQCCHINNPTTREKMLIMDLKELM